MSWLTKTLGIDKAVHSLEEARNAVTGLSTNQTVTGIVGAVKIEGGDIVHRIEDISTRVEQVIANPVELVIDLAPILSDIRAISSDLTELHGAL